MASTCAVVGWDSFHSTAIVRGYCERERFRHSGGFESFSMERLRFTVGCLPLNYSVNCFPRKQVCDV